MLLLPFESVGNRLFAGSLPNFESLTIIPVCPSPKAHCGSPPRNKAPGPLVESVALRAGVGDNP